MAEWRFARALLGAGHGRSDDGEDVHDGDEAETHDDTQALRIVSIFVILAAGLLGGLPPLFMKVFRDPDSMLTKLVRSLAAGVIMALALVHIIPEAVEEMSGLGGIEYPLGGTCALFGIALMVFLEHVAHIMNTRTVAAALPPTSGFASSPSGGLGKAPTSASLDFAAPSEQTGTVAVPAAAVADGKQPMPLSSPSGRGALHEGAGAGRVHPGHGHVCVSRGPASNWLTAAAVEAVGSLRLKVVAYLFELGCIFHSFIIGLSLGVNQTDLTEVRSLLIALSFHQWLEGISLASVVIRGGFSALRGALMILTYSLTCPVGIAIGMAIAETYDAESNTARGVQGTFNGVSGGMLLYISLVQLVAEDMGRMTPGRDSAFVRLASCGALCAGAASMCLLAVWA